MGAGWIGTVTPAFPACTDAFLTSGKKDKKIEIAFRSLSRACGRQRVGRWGDMATRVDDPGFLLVLIVVKTNTGSRSCSASLIHTTAFSHMTEMPIVDTGY